jgi:hypothetical protein
MRFIKRINKETGSDAYVDYVDSADYTGAEYQGAGHPVPVQTVATSFYKVNPARYNGQDREPIPITPVRGQNWPEMQIQLRNGWGTTSFGRRLTYDDYLRLLTDSATKNRKYLIPQPSSAGRAGSIPGPSPLNVQTMVNQSSGGQPSNQGAPGMIASGVNLSGRRYYG